MASKIATDPRIDPRIQLLMGAFPALPQANVDSYEALLAEARSPEGLARAAVTKASLEAVDTEAAAPSKGLKVSEFEFKSDPDGNKIKVRVTRPDNGDTLPCVTYFHGGGMAFGSAYDGPYRAWARVIANQGVCVAMVDFRNYLEPSSTPEVAQYPAGLNDCVSGVKWVASHAAELGIDPEKIIVAGESGGGNLAIATALKLNKEGNIGLIKGIYALCPFIAGSWPRDDLPSTISNNGILLDLHNNRWTVGYGLSAFEAKDPLAWPLFSTESDVAGFPPTRILVNECDPLLDEGIAFYRLLLRAGVPARCKQHMGTIHGTEIFHVCPDVSRDTARDIAALARGEFYSPPTCRTTTSSAASGNGVQQASTTQSGSPLAIMKGSLEGDDGPAGLLGFTPSEYAALFPHSGPALGAAADPDPPTYATFDADVLPPLLRAHVRGVLWFKTHMPRGFGPGAYAAWCVSMAALLAPAWGFGRARFGLRQLAVATAFRGGTLLLFPVQYGVAAPGAWGWLPAARPGDQVSLDGVSTIARYRRLAAEDAAGSSALLRHDAGDGNCPCCLPGCAGPLAGSRADAAAAARFAVHVVHVVVEWCFGMSYTAFYTLGSANWSEWWSILLSSAFLAVSAVLLSSQFVNETFFDTSVATLSLQRRLHVRALNVLLDRTVEGCERVAEHVCRGAAGPDPASQVPLGDDYAALFSRYAACWNQATASSEAGMRFFAFAVLSEAVVGIANLVAGSCVTFNTLATLVLLTEVFTHLVVVAVANREVTELSALVRRARSRIRTAARRIGVAPTDDPASRAAVLSALEGHKEELSTMLEADEHRATFFGFPITGATVRGTLLTFLTLLVGLYSVLRAGGTFVTMDIVCPFQSA
ncbi:Alpha/Beta hydrolase protein [Hyaloraphidium curvatum]|nr:Alpha/Beta hydrolase protein [Hyaloraphidium curvatum]